jgi:hypothetical protein
MKSRPSGGNEIGGRAVARPLRPGGEDGGKRVSPAVLRRSKHRQIFQNDDQEGDQDADDHRGGPVSEVSSCAGAAEGAARASLRIFADAAIPVGTVLRSGRSGRPPVEKGERDPAYRRYQ